MSHIHRFLLAFAALMLVLATAPAAQEADVSAGNLFAVAAEGEEADAQISKLAGIAPFYHLYDESGRLVEVVANPFLDQEFGIGPAAANMLADKGAGVIIGRRVPGPKMMDVVQERQMRFVRRVGTVADVASELRE